ncbi:hypothetical protein [Streptomyces lydicus]|uniref:hypothetical protein n=1 Tax=Streptomyces lydicus TaxID=47763 RepID=UPI0037924366
MTDDLRTQLRAAIASADGFSEDSLELHDYQEHADAVLAIVQPELDRLRTMYDVVSERENDLLKERDALLLHPEHHATTTAEQPLCAECGHPKDEHEDADEPVSVGLCKTCDADGDEDNAWHNYEPPAETA